MREEFSNFLGSGGESIVCCHMGLGLYGLMAGMDSRLGLVEVCICSFICSGNVVCVSEEISWLFVLGERWGRGGSVKYVPGGRVRV